MPVWWFRVAVNVGHRARRVGLGGGGGGGGGDRRRCVR